MYSVLFRLKSKLLQIASGVSFVGVVLFLVGVSWESGSFVGRFALQAGGVAAVGVGGGFVFAAREVRSLMEED